MKGAFSVKEAAEIVGCCRETLRRAIRRGDLKAAKVGRDFRISRIELRDYWLTQGGGKLFD